MLDVEITVLPVSGSSAIDLGDGLFLQEETVVLVRGYDCDVEVKIGVAAGRLVADEVRARRRADGPTVTSEVLRGIPLASLVSKAAREGVFFAEKEVTSGRKVGMAWPSQEELETANDRGPSDETLRLVARVYRLAYLVGDPPTKRVEDAFGVPRSTAGRWVAAARASGHLAEAPGPGKAGV